MSPSDILLFHISAPAPVLQFPLRLLQAPVLLRSTACISFISVCMALQHAWIRFFYIYSEGINEEGISSRLDLENLTIKESNLLRMLKDASNKASDSTPRTILQDALNEAETCVSLRREDNSMSTQGSLHEAAMNAQGNMTATPAHAKKNNKGTQRNINNMNAHAQQINENIEGNQHKAIKVEDQRAMHKNLINMLADHASRSPVNTHACHAAPVNTQA